MKQLIVGFLICILLFGCSTKMPEPYKPPELNFETIQPYSIQDDLNKIDKPASITPIYVRMLKDGDKEVEFLKVDNPVLATHVLFTELEYSKVGQVIKITKNYRSLINEQEFLINTYIKQINALQELLKLERQKALVYRELWINAENAYREERRDHQIDNIINNITILGLIGGVVAIAIGL